MPEPPKADASKPLTVDDRVGLDRFEFDEEPFITVDTDVCRTCDTKPCLYVCPSKVYRLEKGELVYNTEGCIELGACAIVCKHMAKTRSTGVILEGPTESSSVLDDRVGAL